MTTVGTDVAVVGAGIVGLSTAFALTEAGASVTVYERGVPGQAQSGGESRIFRHAHDDRRLVEFARAARLIGANGRSASALSFSHAMGWWRSDRRAGGDWRRCAAPACARA